MDPHLIDLVWEVHRDVGSKTAIQVVCGYRAPTTNTMLRRRSSGVAQHSQHTVGKAIDFLIPDAKLDDLRAAGLRLQRGGVGFYPGSGWPFVHMDVGSVRHWPRMTHDQLVKVFPDGRTVHVPSDGQPLKGYALALADLEKRGGTPSATSLEAARTAGVNTEKRNTFAALFGFGKKKDRDEDEEADIPARAPQAVASAAPARRACEQYRPPEYLCLECRAEGRLAASPTRRRAPQPVQAAAPVPTPKARPAAPVQTAAVVPAQPAQPARPAQQGSIYSLAALAPVTPNDVINSRGYWKGLPETPIETSAARRIETASADPQVAAVAARASGRHRQRRSVDEGHAGRRRNRLRASHRAPGRAAPGPRRADRRPHQQRHSAQHGRRRRHHRRAQGHAAAPVRNPDRPARLASGDRPRRRRALAARHHRARRACGLT